MKKTPQPPMRRYRGQLVWFDSEGRVRQGRIDRAILRPRGLSLELTTGGQPYTVTLEPHEKDLLHGTWSRGAGTKQTSGAAECSLSPCGETIGRPGGDNLKLEGSWYEDGQWDWVARLLPIPARA
jgi:hypothetical protein